MVAKPNYGFQKRQKELAKQQKREAKAKRKEERAERGDDAATDSLSPTDDTPPDDS